MSKAQSMDEVIGTMTGARGIVFIFDLAGDRKAHVTFDFYNNGTHLNGKTYKDMEAEAVTMIHGAGLVVSGWTHKIIK